MSISKEKVYTEKELYKFVTKEQFKEELHKYRICKENGAEVVSVYFECNGKRYIDPYECTQDLTINEVRAVLDPDFHTTVYNAYKLGFMRGSKTGLYKIRINQEPQESEV